MSDRGSRRRPVLHHVARIGSREYDEALGALRVYPQAVLRDAAARTGHARRAMVSDLDVVHALERHGRTLP